MKINPIILFAGAAFAFGAAVSTAQSSYPLSQTEDVVDVTDIDSIAADPITADYCTGDMGDVFESIHVNVLELLDYSARVEMLSRYQAGQPGIAKNSEEGESRLDTLTDDYCRVQVTGVSTLQIKRLPVKKGGCIFVTVYTVGDDDSAADSDIRFWDDSLKELPRKKYFKAPEIDAFFSIPKGCSTTYKEIRGMIPFPTVTYTLSPVSDKMEARQTAGKYINQDDYNIIRIFEKPELTYEWDGSKFKLLKE